MTEDTLEYNFVNTLNRIPYEEDEELQKNLFS